jgi:CheY-like chemotaxis protein
VPLLESGWEILLVEDNPADVLLTREAFRESRHVTRISVAEDGEAALRFLRKQGKYANERRPDLILLDLNLPRKDGRELLAELKADPNLRQIPVIVLTTSSAEQDVDTAYELHANCYLTKPLDINEFLRKVRSIEDFWLTVVRLPN